MLNVLFICCPQVSPVFFSVLSYYMCANIKKEVFNPAQLQLKRVVIEVYKVCKLKTISTFFSCSKV